MEIFLTVLKYAAGPVLGAVIGYFTNWLAVKMLFRPYYLKKIGKWQLPFTPGIIPKRKSALAKAVGKAVGEQLFTKEDLAASLNSDAAKEKAADYMLSLWHSAGDKPIKELMDVALTEERSQALLSKAEQVIGDKIYSAVQKADLGAVIASEGKKAIAEKRASLGMLAMFLSDELVSSLANKLSEGVNRYIEQNGKNFIRSAVHLEAEKAAFTPVSSYISGVDEQTVRNMARSLYEKIVVAAAAQLAESIDISAIVEEKINAMDVKELEKLVLSVMKKELNSIVNLGALIGFILGLVMIFI